MPPHARELTPGDGCLGHPEDTLQVTGRGRSTRRNSLLALCASRHEPANGLVKTAVAEADRQAPFEAVAPLGRWSKLTENAVGSEILSSREGP